MLFNSYEFLFVFLPLSLVGFYGIGLRSPERARDWLLLVSVVFYGYWDVRAVPLLLASILFNYAVGRRLQAVGRRQPIWLYLGIGGNLLLLGAFKYLQFAVDNLGWLLGLQLQVPALPLPLGISFFTFTQIAFLVDAWRNQASEYRLRNYGVFVTFFPHLLAGPILHHRDMMPQVSDGGVARYRPAAFSAGLMLLAIGLAKKVLIADQVAPWANAGFGNAGVLGLVDAWLAALAYTVQIYFDFSGYSDMAVGLGLMFNIRLPINFRSPYQAVGVRDFWHRWHISLSAFLRDYVYIPLGGNRRGWWATNLFVVLTFLIGGLWHGANWTFVLWGLLNGLAVAGGRIADHLGIHLPAWSARLLTFLFVVVCWVVFRAPTVAVAGQMLQAMAGGAGILGATAGLGWAPLFDGGSYLDGQRHLLYPPLYTATILVLGLGISWFGRNSQDLVQGRTLGTATSLTAGVLCALAVLSLSRPSEFLYFNF